MVRSTIAAAVLFAVCDAVTLTTESPPPLFVKLMTAVGGRSGIVDKDGVKDFKDLWMTSDAEDKYDFVNGLKFYCGSTPRGSAALAIIGDEMILDNAFWEAITKCFLPVLE